MENFKEFQLSAINWHAISMEDVQDAFDENLRKSVVKQNPLRTISAVYANDGNNPKYFLKHDHGNFLSAKIKHFFRCKVEKEFESARLLLNHDVPCINYLAWGQKGFEGYLLSEAFKDSQDLNECWQEIKNEPLLRKNFISAFTDLIVKTLNANILHPDLHIGNMLVHRQNEDFIFKYVDVYGVKQVSILSINQKLKMLVVILWFYHDLSPYEAENFLDSFARYFPFNKKELRQKIIKVWSLRANHFRTSRRKKVLKQSSQINLVRNKAGVWRMVKDLNLSDAKKILEKHKKIVSNDPNQLIKNDKKRRLSRVVLNDKSFVVKEFFRIRFKGIFASDRRSWLNAAGLKTIGIPACRYFAWFHSNKNGYVVMEDLGDNLIHYELIKLKNNPDILMLLLVKLVKIIALLHNSRIVFKDVKTSNFIVGSDSTLRLIDLDDVIFNRSPSMKCRLKAFETIKETMPVELTRLQILRLLTYYRKEAGIKKSQVRWLLKKITES